MATHPDGPDRPLTHSPSPKPGTYFIAHAYRDAASRDRLLEVLPSVVEPFVFPKLEPAPDGKVSQEVIEAIRRCDGLIYLKEGYSASSAWVGFERDYALRIGVPVLSFDFDSQRLERDGGPPLKLGVEAHFSEDDRGGVEKILASLERERSIVRGELSGYGERRTALVFWTAAAARSRAFNLELEVGLERLGRKILICRLDGVSPPDWLAGRSAGIVPMQEDPAPIDDLVVALYWLAVGERPGESSPGPSK